MKNTYVVAAILGAILLVAANGSNVYALGGAGAAIGVVPGITGPTIGGLTTPQLIVMGYYSGARPSGFGMNYYGGNNSYTSPYYYWDGAYGYYNVPDRYGSTKQSCVWNGYKWQCYNFNR